jgi:hypothetical protein
LASRIQVDSQLGKEQLRPTASPVDQFVQVNPNSGAAQLARALSDFAPSVRALGLTAVDQKHANDTKAGAELAGRLAIQKKSYDDAVKEGTIPRGANPFFMAGVKEQYGKVMATKFSSDLAGAVAGDENMQRSTSLQEYDDFVKGKTDEWLKSNVPDNQRDEFFDAGFQDSVLNAMAGQRQQFAAGIADRIEKLGDDALYGRVNQLLSFSTILPEAFDGLVKNFQGEVTDLIQHQGRNPKRTMRTIIDAFTDRAIDTNSSLMLTGLDKLVGTDGVTASMTQYGRDKIRAAKDQIRVRTIQARVDQIQEVQQDQEARTNSIMKDLIPKLVSNPQTDVRQLITDNSDIKGLAEVISGVKARIGHNEFDDNQITVGNLTRRLFKEDGTATTIEEVAAQINNGNTGITWQTAHSLMSTIEQRDRALRGRAGDALRDAFNHEGYTREKNNIRGRLQTIFKGTLVDQTQRQDNAMAKLSMAWLSHLNNNPKETFDQQSAWLNAEGAKIVDEEKTELSFNIDPRGAAFKSDGTPIPAHAEAVPRYTYMQALRISKEIDSKRLSKTTTDWMTQNHMTQDALDDDVHAALNYWTQKQGAK